MQSKPSLCFVAPNIYPVLARDRNVKIVGGAEVQQSILARAFAAAGYQVSVACTDVGQPEGVEVDGVKVHRTYRAGTGLPVLRFFHPHISLTWRALRRADADIYYQRGCGHLTGIVAAFCRLHGRQFVFSGAHDKDFDQHLPLLQSHRNRVMYRWGLTQADAVVVQNPLQSQAARAWGFDSQIIGSCYQPTVGAALQENGYVLWVARICPWKRPEWFIQIARCLPQYRFRMVGGAGTEPGEDAFADEIRRQAETVPNLEFVGFVPHADIEREFDGARLLVNTSEAEGFPNTFLQAWARGMPTVSYVQSAFGDDGRVIGCVAQDVEGMAQLTQRLMSDDMAWREEGERCRDYFNARHSVEQAFDAYSALFERLLKDKKGSQCA